MNRRSALAVIATTAALWFPAAHAQTAGEVSFGFISTEASNNLKAAWQPLLDALRAGRFFVTTGEMFVHDFTVGGKASGETLSLRAADRPELRVTLAWTFPPRFAEVISGDGTKVYREQIDLADMEAFGKRTLTLRPELGGRRWVRLEAWDVATNGAFTQPVWLVAGSPK